jgi:hypothetical protein
MKKIFVVASILLMCCMFMGCGVKGQLVGTWKSSVEYEDSESYANFEVTIMDDITLEFHLPAICISKTSDTLTLNKDGTFSWNTVETYTFTVNMDVAEDDEEIPEGATLKSLASEYKKPFKTIRNMCTRENNKLRNFNIPKQRGRKPAKTLQEYKYENKRLRMENELLRDFLSLTERM